MELNNFGFLLIVTGSMSAGLFLGFVLKKLVTNAPFLHAQIIRSLVRLSNKFVNGENLCSAARKMAGDIGDNALVPSFEKGDHKVCCKEMDVDYKHKDVGVHIADYSHLEYLYYKRKEQIFSPQRKLALEELCMKFEDTIFLMILIALFFHLLPEAAELERSMWEFYIEILKIHLWRLVAFCQTCLKQLALTAAYVY